MRYLVLVLLVGMFGCSGPVLKKDCLSINGADNEYSCSSDSRSQSCVFVADKDRFVCDK